MSVYKTYIASITNYNADPIYKEHAIISATNAENAMTKLIFHMKNHKSENIRNNSALSTKTFVEVSVMSRGCVKKYVSTDKEYSVKLTPINLNTHDVIYLASHQSPFLSKGENK